jgi:[protein-PII] uridylyltransferase
MVRCRPSPTGEGLQIMVFAPDAPDLFARICGYFDHNSISVQDAKIYTAPNGRALDTFQVVAPHMSEHYRELSTMVERDLADTLAQAGPLPKASHGRVSRRVKNFPIAPRVNLQPDEKAQRWLLSVSASDRVGLLYGIAQILARHQIHLQLAKISTLGERVEDTFLIDGPSLQHNRSQIDIETELLESLSV